MSSLEKLTAQVAIRRSPKEGGRPRQYPTCPSDSTSQPCGETNCTFSLFVVEGEKRVKVPVDLSKTDVVTALTDGTSPVSCTYFPYRIVLMLKQSWPFPSPPAAGTARRQRIRPQPTCRSRRVKKRQDHRAVGSPDLSASSVCMCDVDTANAVKNDCAARLELALGSAAVAVAADEDKAAAAGGVDNRDDLGVVVGIFVGVGVGVVLVLVLVLTGAVRELGDGRDCRLGFAGGCPGFRR